MSAFNDYCIVCDQLCSNTDGVYCSESCKLRDMISGDNVIVDTTQTHMEDDMTTAIDPNTNSTKATLTTPLEPLTRHSTLQYVSPLLTSTLLTGIFDLDQDCLNLSCANDNSIKSKANSISDYLSTTSVNYKKWLHSTGVISN